MKLWNIIHLTLSLIVAFFISSTAFVMGDDFLILRNGVEIGAGFLCAIFFSCLFVFPMFLIMKLVHRTHARDIRAVNTVYALLIGVLLAPLPIAAQEYLFIKKALVISEQETLGTIIHAPKQIDYDEARWWPYSGYTLRGKKELPGQWHFHVMD